MAIRRRPPQNMGTSYMRDSSRLNPKQGDPNKRSIDFNVNTRANNRGSDEPWQVENWVNKRGSTARAINSASHSVANTGLRSSVKPLTNATKKKYINKIRKAKRPVMPSKLG